MQTSSFSADYATARARFRQAVNEIAGSALQCVDYPESGPAQEELSTDVGWIGPRDAERVLVMASGTHGIEGFCGSAAQVEWLDRFKHENVALPDGLAVMLIHAVNPFGFAWRRRVTHENVDLNRNWIDFATAATRNPEYDDIAEPLCPSEWNAEQRESTLKLLLGYAGAHGMAKFVQVVSAGQHRHPDGLFYGGTAATAARQNLTRILQNWLAEARHIGAIDFHSGLGSAGFGELIAASLEGTTDFARTQSWYGAGVKPIGAQGADFARIAGDWLSALPAMLPNATITAIALEFGTVPAMLVLDALRADNWLHTRGERTGPGAEAIRKQMTNAFYVDSDVWRGMVLGQSLRAIRQAIAGLQS